MAATHAAPCAFNVTVWQIWVSSDVGGVPAMNVATQRWPLSVSQSWSTVHGVPPWRHMPGQSGTGLVFVP